MVTFANGKTTIPSVSWAALATENCYVVLGTRKLTATTAYHIVTLRLS